MINEFEPVRVMVRRQGVQPPDMGVSGTGVSRSPKSSGTQSP